MSECKNIFSNKLKEMKVDFSFADLDVHEQLEELYYKECNGLHAVLGSFVSSDFSKFSEM